jgi:polyisoprenoid-binding protein YceI
MKTLFFIFPLVVLFACNTAPKADKAATGETKETAKATGERYVCSNLSSITWTATKPTGSHTGTFKLKEGDFIVSQLAILSGSFIIDINSLENSDLVSDPKNKTKLEGHLKSPDFFNAAKYPTAKFEISAVTPLASGKEKEASFLKDATHTISGNLTLKDSTKNISFPARVTIDANTLSASADFNIDRTLWGLDYKGPGNPVGWFISKQVNLKLSLSANKK